MVLNDWLTLAAIVIGPLIAVLLTIALETRRRRRDSQLVVVRALMATRHLPGDPNYSTAINLVPVEFHDEPRVIEAFKEYSRLIRREEPQTANGLITFNSENLAAQTKLLSAILQAIGMKVSEADLQIEAYAAGGMVARDKLYLDSLAAQGRIATALEKSIEP